MPLQFGLLTGKFDQSTRFETNDHRSFRLPPQVLKETLHALEPAWPLAEKYGISKTGLALSFILSHLEVSTVIPGIKNPEQALDNTTGLVALSASDKAFLQKLYDERFAPLIPFLQKKVDRSLWHYLVSKFVASAAWKKPGWQWLLALRPWVLWGLCPAARE